MQKRKENKRPITVAFDIDDTLWRIRSEKKDQVPDYDLIAVLRWFWSNGDKVYVWSAGGIDYAAQICVKLGIDEYIDGVVEKGLNGLNPDLVFDDALTKLGKVDVHVQRDGMTYEEKYH